MLVREDVLPPILLLLEPQNADHKKNKTIMWTDSGYRSTFFKWRKWIQSDVNRKQKEICVSIGVRLT